MSYSLPSIHSIFEDQTRVSSMGWTWLEDEECGCRVWMEAWAWLEAMEPGHGIVFL